MASRSSSDLSPEMQVLYGRFAEACFADPFLREHNVTVILTCTYRSVAEQDRLYAQGRTEPGPIVTKARGGQSKHNTLGQNGNPAAEAFDVVPIKDGKCVWGTDGADGEIWQHIGFLGSSVGLEWYGLNAIGRMREFPHFENPEA